MMSAETYEQSMNIGADEINARLTMQLATSRDGQPWNSTVYFVIHLGSFYWLSFPERRHSQDIAVNPQAAIAIVLEPTQPVIGVQAEGIVGVVEDIAEAESVLGLYVKKYDQGKQFIALLKTGNNKHVLYRLTPRYIGLFDERRNDQGGMASRTELVIT